MIDHYLADVVVLIHAGFVLFVVLGGFLALRWRWLVWVHVPAAVWGVLIEFAGWTCPLTPLEHVLRARAGETGYGGGFIEHYVLRGLYPHGLTRQTQWILGALALGVNVVAYAVFVRNRAGKRAVSEAA